MSPVTTTFSGLNEEVLEDSILPQDLQEVLERLGTAEAGAEGSLIEDVSSSAASGDEDGEPVAEDVALDLSAGEFDKGADPVRLYMREMGRVPLLDRKSTRLNSSHTVISYAVFCLKKKNKPNHILATGQTKIYGTSVKTTFAPPYSVDTL